MSESKAIRLTKVARELNVGLATIVEFLNKKGYKVENNPNAKIDDEIYGVLLAEYQTEKSEKEKSRKVTSSTKEKRETVTITEVKRPTRDQDAEPEEEIMIKNVPVKNEPEVVKPKVESDVKVSVIGKIDLGTVGKKKTTKKAAEPEVKKEKEKEKEVEKPVEKPVAKKTTAKKTEEPAPEPVAEAPVAVETPVVVETPVETPVKEEAIPVVPEIETHKTEYSKLSGPKIVGKIDLPVARDNQSSSSAGERKKRKRIKKVNIDQAAKQQTQRDNQKKRPERNAPKPEVTAEDIQKEIKETLARLSSQGGKSKSSKIRREKRDIRTQLREEEMIRAAEEEKVLKLTEFVTVSDLAKMMNASPTQIISACMTLGIFASINQRLDAETIAIIAEEFGYQVQFVTADIQESIDEDDQDDPEDLVSRSPIVTVMGHVDHGKTSLLDYVRKANVIAGEAGGITQHIGAYAVQLDNGKKITFLDTPGHEAFTAMRARGAKVTDIAIIVIAADDSVMPQTKEAIAHAQAAGVPMIFALNKIDKPEAKPDKIREDLANMDLLVEEWGGKFQSQEISAKKGLGVKELLEKVLLEAELLDLKANPNRRAKGTVIESMLDKGRGYVSTILVSSGTLEVGDVLLAGSYSGRVKAMFNERGSAIAKAGPSTPVSILGLDGAPNAGDLFNVMDDEREARNIATRRQQLLREQGMRTHKHITLDEIGRRLAIGDFKELNIIIKGDVDGSVEALADSLLKLSTDRIQVKIVHKGVGAISESDVLLASASNAVIIGFQVRPSAAARRLAETEEIDVRLYSIIYKAIEEVKDAMEGMLSPEKQEKIIGTVEVRQVFRITKVGTVAGSYVQDGKITRQSKVRVIRDGIVIHDGTLNQLKRFKDDVKEATAGYECGLSINGFNDINEGDIIEAYEEVEVKSKL
ncbi:MAG TPA: translation initiation factor IF-2 [Flavobacteriales bacterium]|nr:translation initiation factor IF-2 [Flavobacteriales bacterium]HRE73632.1 translation initiation factor IF-2 [Flavobacteriales bacterium]HRE95307.1 translation initiation factor IF-2 [Flavobacteriales bacterium]HRJ37235.1 translation initiation factor IF-2 [Flavobacteriales bacterium]